MKIITIFFPAIISIHLFLKRNNSTKLELSHIIRVYCMFSLVQNFITWVIVDYGLGIVVNEDAFSSMQFAIKYLIIAVVVSLIVPYLSELISKYIKVEIDIEENASEKK